MCNDAGLLFRDSSPGWRQTMSGHDTHGTFSGIDTSRRSFLQKSAIASGAIALGGTTVGCVSAEEHDADNDADDGDYVLMLYPDAVEGASATVVSDEIDWHPWDDDDDEENGQEYRTHLAEFDFSASHVAPVFVPEDVEIDVDEEINLGEIRDLLHGPDDPIDGPVDDDDEPDDDIDEPDDDVDDDDPIDDENGPDEPNNQPIGENGEAVLVEIALEDEAVDDDPVDDDDDIEDEPEDDPDEPDDDVDDDVEPDDDPIDDDNGPDDAPENDDDGLLNF